MKGFTTPPVLAPNPNPRAPLAAVLSIATEEPVSGEIEIQLQQTIASTAMGLFRRAFLKRDIFTSDTPPGRPTR